MITTHNLLISRLTISAIAATIVFGAAFQIGAKSATDTPTVTITAHKMTEQQKMAYDESQSGQIVQTVMIEHPRLSAEQKLAFDKLDRQIQATNKHSAKKHTLLV